jgi:hypothetical protein
LIFSLQESSIKDFTKNFDENSKLVSQSNLRPEKEENEKLHNLSNNFKNEKKKKDDSGIDEDINMDNNIDVLFNKKGKKKLNVGISSEINVSEDKDVFNYSLEDILFPHPLVSFSQLQNKEGELEKQNIKIFLEKLKLIISSFGHSVANVSFGRLFQLQDDFFLPFKKFFFFFNIIMNVICRINWKFEEEPYNLKKIYEEKHKRINEDVFNMNVEEINHYENDKSRDPKYGSIKSHIPLLKKTMKFTLPVFFFFFMLYV